MDKRELELDKEAGIRKDWRGDKKELTWIGGR